MSWVLHYNGYDAAQEGLRETLCTLGNGRFATRGAFSNVVADGVHYPGTYLAGGYNRLVTEIAGHPVENEDLVNWPNWLPLRFKPADGHWTGPGTATIEAHQQTLHVREGRLTRETVYRDEQGRLTEVYEERFVSMADPTLAAIALRIVPLNWSGTLHVESAIDGSVTNQGVPRYKDLVGEHFAVASCEAVEPNLIRLECRTVQSGVAATFAARTMLTDGKALETKADVGASAVATTLSVAVREGEPVGVEKVVAFVTSRDPAIASTSIAATNTVAQAGPFTSLLADNRSAWTRLWDDFDIVIEDGSSHAEQHLHLHLFHLIQTLSPHTADMDVGAPARGWHGEAYRGHIFWDEMFIFRVLNLRAPRLTRALLRYRHRRIGEARRLAKEAGLAGAMYPWQSGSDGREETQTLHLNPVSGRWLADNTHRQRHVGLAVAYNVWSYYRATNDLDFMIEAGAEMLVEIARFFTALATWDEDKGRYRICGVMGPDEFHTAPKGKTDGGIDDNAYTNVLCAWMLTRTVDALENLPPSRRVRLCTALSVAPDEITRWQDISERLYVPFLANGIVAQFEGYEELDELDWDHYRSKYRDIHRLDRILEAEGKSPNDFKLAKQADVLMLPFLFSADILVQIFEQLGYVFHPSDIPRLVEYYDQRTSHGSTLSTIAHAWVVARTNRAQSWDLFRQALRADVNDVQGGTTREGIHLGAMCGTIDMVQSGYMGCEVRSDALHVDPVLPDALSRVRTRLRYQGQDIALEATSQTVTIATGGGSGNTISVVYRGRQRHLPPGASTTYRLVRPHRERLRAAGDGETDSDA